MAKCTVVCVGIGVETEKYGVVVVRERGDVAKAAMHGWRSCGTPPPFRSLGVPGNKQKSYSPIELLKFVLPSGRQRGA